MIKLLITNPFVFISIGIFASFIFLKTYWCFNHSLGNFFSHSAVHTRRYDQLIVDTDGSIDFISSSDEPVTETLILSPNSRVSFIGFWLYFIEDNVEGTNAGSKEENNEIFKKCSQPFFIFRDSLSSQEQSRLSRVITYVKYQATKEVEAANI